MSRRLLLAAVSLLCLLSFARAQASFDRGDERVFFNAKIFTAEPEHPYADAIAIRDDKIVAVGSRPDVVKAVSKNAEMVDLHSKTLFPGFIDSHAHPIEGGLTLLSADIGENVRSVDELASFAAEAKKTGKGMRGDILVVTGVPLMFWSRPDELNARFSSGAYAGQAVFFEGMDGHTGWANRALLRRAGITKDFLSHLSEGERKYYGYTAGLEPNGFGVDAGLAKIRATMPPPSAERLRNAGRAALRYNHSLGITAWLDAVADEPTLAAYKALSDGGELTAHIAALPRISRATILNGNSRASRGCASNLAAFATSPFLALRCSPMASSNSLRRAPPC